MIKSTKAAVATLGAASTMVLLLASGATAAQAQTTTDEGALAPCEIHELPLPEPAIFSAVTAGDPSGRWLGGYLTDDVDYFRTLLWDRGELVDLDLDLIYASVDGINRDGVLVGTGTNDARDTMAYAHVDGDTVTLAALDGASYGHPKGISANGTVAGYSFTPGKPFEATIWSLDRPDDPTSPKLPSGTAGSEAVGVSANGQVAVKATMGDGRVRSFVYSRTGARTELKPLEKGADLTVIDIANGWATAHERDSDSERFFLRYDLSTGKAEEVAIAGTVNKDGVVGGREYPSERGALYTDRVLRLPDLAGVEGGAEVVTIDNRGNPAGLAGNTSFFESAAVRWSCDLG